jgi:hypothetical protein
VGLCSPILVKRKQEKLTACLGSDNSKLSLGKKFLLKNMYKPLPNILTGKKERLESIQRNLYRPKVESSRREVSDRWERYLAIKGSGLDPLCI